MSTTPERFGPVGQADEKQLLLLMNDWRHGRADRNIWQALSDAYVMLFGVVLIGAMLISGIMQAQQSVAGCGTETCLAARGLLPWAAMAGVLTFTLVVCRMFGPVVASAAEGFWLMEAPLDRRRILSGRLVRALGIAFAAGALFGALVAALTGSSLPHVGIWALAAGFGAFGLTAFAAAEQGLERSWTTLALQVVVALVAVVTLAALVGISAGWLPAEPLEKLSVEFALLVAGAGLLLGIVSAVLAMSRLRRIRRQRLTSGSSLISGMQGAAFALDFALVRDILVEHRARRKGHVRPTRGVGRGVVALIMRDVQRLWRNPAPLATWLGSMVVPYAIQALGVPAVNAPISALILMVALIGFFNSLRVLSRTKGLQRCFPFDPGTVRTATMVVPGVLAFIWAVITTPAFIHDFRDPAAAAGAASIAMITGLAGFIGAIRWVSAKPADYSTPMVAVGVGAMPPGMMFSILRGIDMVALITLPVVFGWSPWISAVIALIAFSFLRSGIDQQSLMEQQEEQKRLLEEAKAQREGASRTREKVRVQRKR